MKRKTVKRRNSSSCRKGKRSQMKGTLATHLQVSLLSFQQQSSSAAAASISNPNPFSRFQNGLHSAELRNNDPAPSGVHLDVDVDEKDFILSQDFFCTPDYITPDNQHLLTSLDLNEENAPCPKSPEKLSTVKNKRCRLDGISTNPLSPTFSSQEQMIDLAKDAVGMDEVRLEKTTAVGPRKTQNYVSQSAIALRCRVMPPPCIRNPYLKDASEMIVDPFGNQRSKCDGLFTSTIGADGLSRYHTDFHEIEQIGNGNFSHVFKVLKRIDGCLYAVKQSTRHLHQDTERRKALMEVQALAALGYHNNIVGYYSSWFESEQLYIQMELCEHNLTANNSSLLASEGDILEAMYQTAKALQFIHDRGIAHLDVKPENIYVKNGVYKLGDFGCATLIDSSLPVEEGDARYMPQEILNEKYDHLDKVDIYSLGVTIFELVRRSPLTDTGLHFMSLREGKLPLLPGHSLQFQSLLKAMLDPDPVRRPSAREVVENPIFDKVTRRAKR